MNLSWNYLFIFALFDTSRSTVINKCTRGAPPLQLAVKGCDKGPCAFVKGTDVQLAISILANNNITKLTTQVKAFAMGTETIYPLPQSNACLSLTNGECPLDEGEEVTYALTMPILTSYPTIPVIIEFSLNSENGVVSCFRLSANVVDE
ncbi:protein NPC2 homolog [Cimex lectularius]|uniref:MD-2-related lipid-recognition domain-containing protein n=1 Tax=Cimex lectularius TaxID=79782 RepID=A0A8I6SS35_CIMLE|nr:protein NPC2 homolog [Cimex lectularius]